MKTISQSIILILSFFLVYSCKSVRYQAHYEFRPKTEQGSAIDPKPLIMDLAAKKYLRIDSSFIKRGSTDTIAYSGVPYHYFKFVFNNKDTNKLVIDFNYNGGPGRTKMYQSFLNDVTVIIGDHFVVTRMLLKDN